MKHVTRFPKKWDRGPKLLKHNDLSVPFTVPHGTRDSTPLHTANPRKIDRRKRESEQCLESGAKKGRMVTALRDTAPTSRQESLGRFLIRLE